MIGEFADVLDFQMGGIVVLTVKALHWFLIVMMRNGSFAVCGLCLTQYDVSLVWHPLGILPGGHLHAHPSGRRTTCLPT